MNGTFLPRPSEQEQTELQERSYDPSRPVLVGIGPVEFATTLALEAFPAIIWDVNGYYRDLGLNPKSSRREIKARYQQLQGDASVRLTMIASVLLNAAERLRYDTTPLGELYPDAEIEALIRERLTDAVKGKPQVDGESYAPTISEIIERKRDSRDVELTPAPKRDHWSYYQLGTQIHDPERLARWRAFLSQVCYGDPHEKPRRLSVGYMVGEEECRVETVGYRTVFFLNVESEPSYVLAWRAFHMLDTQ